MAAFFVNSVSSALCYSNVEAAEEKLEAPGRKSSVMVLSPLGVPYLELPVGPGFVNSTARHLPGYKTEAKANGLRGDLPCAMGPLPATDRLEAKQLRMCLLSKRELRY